MSEHKVENMDFIEFKKWLTNNTTYTSRVISNTISRLKRADRIHSVRAEDIYLFELEHIDDFKALSVDVQATAL